ncbi:unnamed protein product [Callosobruchus maculatus]|uniref:Uncharacterized protein n=1 Tax=Callosobruchus maculatus TaxID=64391 RepID=A0A653D0F1_CALMS|nr:unnamed protein product [Callosobruchus maculatus]
MLSWERQRELYDHLAYLKEKEKADNFSWDDWRKRFLKFMNYKKSRLTDLFRKMDKDNNELIPREDFIDGIIKTKFDTSRLEMKHVADMFDENNRGLIDWKKFIAALRPDWEERPVDNDAQKIHDEVKRLVMLCTCRQKFRVFQVGEGKYRFGESQKLRLVRILRSTVMVRVGGGWVALDEFLLKNDPCRADEHMAELMPIFNEIRARGECGNAYPLHVGSHAGPTLHTHHVNPNTCYLVRERSQRSVPMGGLPRTSKSSLSAGTPDSLSDNESGGGTFRTPRRPSSSYRSTLTPGGIPRRTPTSTSGRSASTLSSAKKSTNGSGSRPRTPTGLISPASPSLRSSGIPRASSIPTLTGNSGPSSRRADSARISFRLKSRERSDESRIPVFKGKSEDTEADCPSTSSSCSVSFSSAGSASSSKVKQVTIGVAPTLRTASRTRTPSGSNTPVLPDQQTAVSKLLRRPSGASDTPTGHARKKQQLSEREPFRL